MLSYDDALARILQSVETALSTESVPLDAALGRVLARDIVAEQDIPAFDNSAVDGFAVRLADTATASPAHPLTLPVVATIAAGDSVTFALTPGTAARILTGAMVPDGADAIVMVEDSTTGTDDGTEFVHLTDGGASSHIRRAGSDLPAGTAALDARTEIDAGAIGLLAALNQVSVPCFARPRVGLIVTGDELIPVGEMPLALGQIRNSNGPSLAAAIAASGGIMTIFRHAADDETATREALLACAADCDLIVSSGGVSVGAFDYVKSSVEALGALDFWRIAIKPGKPLAFGRVGETPFVGLPGNPVSSLVTFELFVRPLLRKMGGHREPLRRRVSAVLSEALPHAPGRREFVRATLDWQNDTFLATPTGAQTSHRLASLQTVDAYLIADEDHGDYPAGARLQAMLLRA